MNDPTECRHDAIRQRITNWSPWVQETDFQRTRQLGTCFECGCFIVEVSMIRSVPLDAITIKLELKEP